MEEYCDFLEGLLELSNSFYDRAGHDEMVAITFFTTIDATKLERHALITATLRKSGKVWQEELNSANLFNILEMLRNKTIMEYEVEIED